MASRDGTVKSMSAWLAPAAPFIEGAIDSLKDADPRMIESQTKELESLGDERARKLGASGLSDDFHVGYRLGLQTARMILAESQELELKGIKPDSLL